MTLKEARKSIDLIDNEIERLIGIKTLLFLKTQPQSIVAKEVGVQESFRKGDKALTYLMKVEEQCIDERLSQLKTEKEIYEKWIEQELNIYLDYGDLEQVIRHLREDVVISDSGRKRSLTWEEIGQRIHYSPDYCREIYREIKKKTSPPIFGQSVIK